MQTTTVDETGTVRCPKCNATSFSDRRTFKGRMLAGHLAPKRLRCRGCGTMLKFG